MSLSENVSIFSGFLAVSLIYFLPWPLLSPGLAGTHRQPSAAVQGTGGPMPVPASATRDIKKGQFDVEGLSNSSVVPQ